MQICLKRGSKSASHSYVTGGSQTGRAGHPFMLSKSNSLLLVDRHSGTIGLKVSLSFNSPSRESFRDLLLLGTRLLQVGRALLWSAYPNDVCFHLCGASACILSSDLS